MRPLCRRPPHSGNKLRHHLRTAASLAATGPDSTADERHAAPKSPAICPLRAAHLRGAFCRAGHQPATSARADRDGRSTCDRRCRALPGHRQGAGHPVPQRRPHPPRPTHGGPRPSRPNASASRIPTARTTLRPTRDAPGPRPEMPYRLRLPASAGSRSCGETVMPTRPTTLAFSMRQNRWSMTLRTSSGRLMSMAAGEWSRLW